MLNKKIKLIILCCTLVGALVSKTVLAAVAGELVQGDLLTAPPMTSVLGAQSNLMVTMDNGPQSHHETAWNVAEQIPSLPLAADVKVGNLTPFFLANRTAPFKMTVETMHVTYQHTLKTAIHRSHYTNPQYYNPAWTYLPWNKTQYNSYFTQYPANAAPLDINVTATETVDLTKEYKYDTTDSSWSGIAGVDIVSTGPVNARWGLSAADLQQNFKLATYYIYNGPATSGNATGIQNSLTLANFTRVVISTTGSYARGQQRTDCASASVCTGAEELQNFTNWFVYHRTRLNVQKGMATWALARLGEHFRVGLALTNKGVSSVDGQNLQGVYLGVRPFSGTNRSTLMSTITQVGTPSFPAIASSLSSFNPNPLRTTMYNVGTYFSNAASTGAYAENPGTSGAVSECRNSYNFMMTSGRYSTESNASVPYSNTSFMWRGANITAPSAVSIAGDDFLPGAVTATYTTAGNGTVLNVNQSQSPGGTLGDLAMAHYWTDLLPTIANKSNRASKIHIMSLTSSSLNATTGSDGVAIDTASKNPVKSQNLKHNIIGLGMPGAIPYSSFESRQFNSGSYAFNNNWVYGHTNATVGFPSKDREYTDDLQRAATNSHAEFIVLNSRDKPNRLDPKVHLLYAFAKTLEHWTSYTQVTPAVMEEYDTDGTPQVAVYGGGGHMNGGSIVVSNGTGLLGATGYVAGSTAATRPWFGFNAGAVLTYQASRGIRNVYIPLIQSASAAISGRTRLEVSSPTTGNLNVNLTSYMISLIGPNDSEKKINALLGDTQYDQTDSIDNIDTAGNGFVKSFPHGPVLNSHPVVVRTQDYGYWLPAAGNGHTTYKNYLATKLNAPPRVAYGSNGGMFHVFNGNGPDGVYYTASGSTGTYYSPTNTPPPPGPYHVANGFEELAYVPAGVIGKIKSITHPFSRIFRKGVGIADPELGFQYSVDGPASTGDFWNGTVWRSMVTGSLGNGGRGLFAIDVTPGDINNAQGLGGTSDRILWDKTVSGEWGTDWADVGHIRNRTGIYKMTNGQYVVLFGNGAKSDNGKSVLFILNAQTGALIKKITTASTAANNGLMGLAFKFNSKREVIKVYGGDLEGNLWVFNTAGSVSDWNVANGGLPLYKAESAGRAQPITTKPVIYPHPDRAGDIIVFGTGSDFRYQDPAITQQHAMYGVLDNSLLYANGTVPRSSLQTQTLTVLNGGLVDGAERTITSNPVDYDVQRGWVLDLPMVNSDFSSKEAVLQDIRLVANRIVFGSATPVGSALPSTVCGVEEKIFAGITTLDPVTGGRLSWTVYDTNHDNVIDAQDNVLVSGYVVNGKDSTGSTNIAGVLPALVRTGSGFSQVQEGQNKSAVRRDSLRSWRQLIPR